MSVSRPTVTPTSIPGLLVIDLELMGDHRGWFKENWQRQKMVSLGLPDFGPVQNNVSFNEKAGVTRGIHAEPWDKYVSVVAGRVFGAWVDLREGPSFGQLFTAEVGADRAIFVPRGVGNAFQTLVDDTVYSYLVNDHWSADARKSYSFVNLGDPDLAISWPIDLAAAELSESDRNHPHLVRARPITRKGTLIIGANGQLARALQVQFPNADVADRTQIDLTRLETLDRINWSSYDTVINAAAYTKVDEAETINGRRIAWETNVVAVARLVEIARSHALTLVHFSSDYVFDGTAENHPEDEPFSPLGVYGQTKAAGDALVATVQRHYLIRTSWVIGDGQNFVRTMLSLASRGATPEVIDDQVGRLTSAEEIARATAHLLATSPGYGCFNVSGAGDPMSWADIAETVFTMSGRDAAHIKRVKSDQYAVGRSMAPRPKQSVLCLDKITRTGFEPTDQRAILLEAMNRYRWHDTQSQ